MEDGFEMATALVERARRLRQGIGDHGDPYEESLLSGKVTVDLKIAVKEIVDHLRASLDYVAREVVERCSASPVDHLVYFPIVQRGFAQQDFRSKLEKLVPGVLEARPDVAAVMEAAQAFSSQENAWLPDLATVANENWHEQLNVSKRLGVLGTISTVRGRSEMTLSEPGGEPMALGGLASIEVMPADGNGIFTANYIRLESVNRELLSFLDESISGVRRIVEAVEERFH